MIGSALASLSAKSDLLAYYTMRGFRQQSNYAVQKPENLLARVEGKFHMIWMYFGWEILIFPRFPSLFDYLISYVLTCFFFTIILLNINFSVKIVRYDFR